MAKSQWSLPVNESTKFNALDEYDRLMGEQRRQAQAWRLRSVITSAACVVLLIATCVAFTQNKTVPVFIMENELGELKYLGTRNNTSYGNGKITDKMITASVKQFITRMYSLPMDFNVLKDNVTWNYAMMTGDARSKYETYLRAEEPQKKFGQETWSVKIETLLALSGNSYQIDFIVSRTQVKGGITTERKRAVVTTALLEPNEKTIDMNPAGIFVTSFDVTDISTAATNKNNNGAKK